MLIWDIGSSSVAFTRQCHNKKEDGESVRLVAVTTALVHFLSAMDSVWKTPIKSELSFPAQPHPSLFAFFC
jgi:hypothetical protein